MKKVLTILFVVAALVASLMVTVNAAEPVTDIDALKTALTNGGEIVIGAEITADETLVVSAATVLDLGGHTLTLNASEGMYTTANLTVKNGSINAAGDDGIALRANGITVTIESNVTITAGDCCVLIPNANKLPIEGQQSYNNCVINTSGNLISIERPKEYAVISINGGATGCELNVTGGSIIGNGTTAIYFPATTNINISGGRIEGKEAAVYVKSGNLKITGGEFIATGEKKEYAYNGSGTSVSGHAVIIDSCNYPGGNPGVSITGGKFSSVHGDAVASYADKGASRLTGFISGGNLTGVADDLLVSNKKLDANGNVVCAHENVVISEYKAPTYTERGYNEYWHCGACGNNFSDEKCTVEMSEKDIFIDPLIKVIEEGNKVEVSVGAMDSAIEAAADSTTVVVPVLEASSDATVVTVPASSLATVAAADKKLSIETSEVKLTLDSKAVGKISAQAAEAGEITIEVKKIETNNLNKEQKEAIKDKDVAAVISAKVIADGKTISDFGGGKVRVEIPFDPTENFEPTDYKVVYIADDGKVTIIPSKVIDGVIIVELEHFSEYAIVADKKVDSVVENKVENKVDNTVENKVENTTGEGGVGSAPGNEGASASAPEKDNTPKTGAVSILSVVVVLAIVGYVSFRKEER